MALSTKTVIILDHNSNMSKRVQTPLVFDKVMTSKSSSNSDKPGIEVHQTLWSCATEAVSEYCRIVWDIFGMERNVTFVINHNGKVRSLNNWSEQGMEVFMKNFAHLGPPPATPPSSPDVNFSQGSNQNFKIAQKQKIRKKKLNRKFK